MGRVISCYLRGGVLSEHVLPASCNKRRMQRTRLWLLCLLCAASTYSYVFVRDGWYIRRIPGRPIVYRFVGNASNPFARPSLMKPIEVSVQGNLQRAMNIFLRKIAESGVDDEVKFRRRYEHPKMRTLRKQMRRARLEKAARMLKADSPQYLNVNPDYRFVGLRTAYEKRLFADIKPFTPDYGKEQRKQEQLLLNQRVDDFFYSTEPDLCPNFASFKTGQEALDFMASTPCPSSSASKNESSTDNG